MAKTESVSMMQQGDAAHDFALKSVDGAMWKLKDFEGKQGLFVLFMCNHCPYVKARMAEVVALHKEFGGRIAFVGINPNDPEYLGEGMDNMIAFAKEQGITFPYLLDANGAVAKAYGAVCTPDPFLFDKDWKLVYHGRLVDSLDPLVPAKERIMQRNMQKLLIDEVIEPWFNPSLGCSIKFKS